MVTVSLLWHLVTASIRGQMQYRLNFVIGVLSGMFFQGIGIIFVWAILETFTSLGGWSFAEIAAIGRTIAISGIRPIRKPIS